MANGVGSAGGLICSMLKDPSSLRTLALGQVISALIAGTGVCSTFLAEGGINVPTTQSFLNYALLSLYALWRLCKQGTKPLQIHPMKYALLALVDVEANALIVAAYQHTTITSIMLLDCAAIPMCMLLSWRFLGVKFTRQHYAGVSICILGLCILAISDANPSDASSTPNALYGDVLCLGAATLYAVSNVGQEACLQKGRGARVEFLGAMGVFGSIICGIQAAALESASFREIAWTDRSKAAFAGFALCLFAMYSLTTVFLSQQPEAVAAQAPVLGGLSGQGGLAPTQIQHLPARDDWDVVEGNTVTARSLPVPEPHNSSSDSRATLFNLSLLTSDMWAILAAMLLFGQVLSVLYFLALFLVIVGLLVYHSANQR